MQSEDAIITQVSITITIDTGWMETTEKYLLVKENSHQGCAWKKLKTKCDEASRGQQLRHPQMVEQHPSMFSYRQWRERAKASTSAKTTMDRGMIAESTLLFFFGILFLGWGEVIPRAINHREPSRDSGKSSECETTLPPCYRASRCLALQ